LNFVSFEVVDVSFEAVDLADAGQAEVGHEAGGGGCGGRLDGGETLVVLLSPRRLTE